MISIFSVMVNALLFSIPGWIGWDGDALTSSNAYTCGLGRWKVGIAETKVETETGTETKVETETNEQT